MVDDLTYIAEEMTSRQRPGGKTELAQCGGADDFQVAPWRSAEFGI